MASDQHGRQAIGRALALQGRWPRLGRSTTNTVAPYGGPGAPNVNETSYFKTGRRSLDVTSRLAAVRVRALPSAGVFACGVLAGLAYLSWPLGYVVNPSVVGGGLASDLEVPGQPFAWLFISLDIVSGALMVLVAGAIWARSARRPSVIATLLGYAVFGLSSAVSAAVPLSCGIGRAELLACGTEASSYGLHDAVSVVGYLALFVALVGVLGRSREALGGRSLWATTLGISVLWSASGLVFLGLTVAGLPEVACQHVLLVATSAAIALLPFVQSRSDSALRTQRG